MAKKGDKSQMNKLVMYVAIALMVGALIGITITKLTIEKTSFVKTSCQIDMQTLYEKSCTATEECYGRLELCSRQLGKCVTTVQVDKTDIRNIRIPDNQPECEANGGNWKVEIAEDWK